MLVTERVRALEARGGQTIGPGPSLAGSHTWRGWLLGACTLANLAVPTSLPLIFDGIPFRARPELAIFDGLLLLGLLRSIAWLLERTGAVPQRPVRPVAPRIGQFGLLALLGLSLLLFALRLAFPPTQLIPGCLRLGDINSTSCAFSADQLFARTRNVTRFESELAFEPRDGSGWRLGEVNTIELRKRLRDVAEQDSLAFSASYTLDRNQVGSLAERGGSESTRLLITYAGRVVVRQGDHLVSSLPFASESSTTLVELPAAEDAPLVLDYANSPCAFDADASARTPACISMASSGLAEERSILHVSYLDSGGLPRLVTAAAVRSPSLDWVVTLARAVELLLLGIWLLSGLNLVLAMLRDIRSAWRIPLPPQQVAWYAAAASLAAGLFATLGAVGLMCAPIIFKQNECTRVELVSLGIPVVLLLAALAIPVLGLKLKSLVEQLGSWTLVPFLGLPLAMVAGELVLAMPFADQVELLPAGDDPLTYVSWARSLVRDGHYVDMSDFVREGAAAKPLFTPLRGAFFWLFGDGTKFYEQTVHLLLVTGPILLAAILLVAFLRRVNVEQLGPLETAVVAAVVSFSLSYLYGSLAAFAVHWSLGFSEGPAWAMLLLATGIGAISLTARRRRQLVFAAAGSVLAVAVALRIAAVVYALPLLLLLLLIDDSTVFRRSLLWAVTPILVVGIIAITMLFSSSEGLRGYAASNTSVFVYALPGDQLRRDASRLTINSRFSAILVLFAVLALGLVWRALRASSRRFWAPSTPALLLFLGGTVLFEFAALIPTVAGPYYPRTIVFSYQAIASYAAVLIMKAVTAQTREHRAE